MAYKILVNGKEVDTLNTDQSLHNNTLFDYVVHSAAVKKALGGAVADAKIEFKPGVVEITGKGVPEKGFSGVKLEDTSKRPEPVAGADVKKKA